MTTLHAVILGLLQGLTEFLPVSSTAHLVLLPWFMNWTDSGQTFDVALHAGTLVAVLAYFRHDWEEMLLRRRKQLLLVFVGCVPAGIVAGPVQVRAAPHRLFSRSRGRLASHG